MKKFSALEYLHPDGIAHTSIVLGSNCPEILYPELPHQFDGNAELFILAPSAKELNSQVWLEAAVQSMSDDLSADGIGYALVLPRQRRRVMKLLHSAGLILDTAFWHFPDWSSSRYLTPIERFPGQFVLDTILQKESLKRRLARLMLRFSGTRQFLTSFWDPVGICVRRPGARPLFQWLFQGEQQSSSGTAMIRTSWRGSKGPSIAYGFSGEGVLPSVVAKIVTAENASKLEQEAEALQKLRPAARQVGMRVPEVIGKRYSEQHSSLFLSFVPGRSVSDLLASDPDMVSPIMTRVVGWLENWQRTTVTIRPLQMEQLEQILFTPLKFLAPSVQNAERYRDWLMKRSEGVVGNAVPLVAAHNDLTMANILLDEHDQLGLVDWETACFAQWPFVDFYYAVTDAVRIAANRSNWLDAFLACYLPEGSYYANVIVWREQLESALDFPPGFAELCFHACWLHHAANEHQVKRPGESRPFLEIVQWLASHESNLNHN